MAADQHLKGKGLLDFERPRLDSPLYKENTSPHGFGMDPSDGLPKPFVTATFQDTEAADLTPERFVCMAGPCSKSFSFLKWITKDGPRRAACSHYKRQLLPSADKERVVLLRYCAAIRDENGEMRDLGNQEVLACEFRDPPDVESLLRLDAFDEELARRQEARRQEDTPFDPLAALKEQEENV